MGNRGTYEDAGAADEHGGGEGSPVVVPLEVAVADPRLGFVFAHAVDEASVETGEREERGELES